MRGGFVTGPEHFREGEHLLGRCVEFGHGEQRQALAVEATAHFLAALVAVLAEDKHADSVSWREAVGW
jgi:hypothetical protein